jgi:MoaA/NifB/PqqE/SkfB family radical SAM enzyme
MSERAKVLAVQLPAICPLHCDFCRTPNHAEGDSDAVFEKVVAELPRYEELYLTSNGETGFSPIFQKLVDVAHGLGVKVSVLCATAKSVVPGLCRVEISLNEYTEPLATRAIEKAKRLGIPVVISMVDTGVPIHLEDVTRQYGVDGVLVRSLQAEGKSHNNAGSTRWFSRVEGSLGHFPAAAYRELSGRGAETTCINHLGHTVPLLGSPF